MSELKKEPIVKIVNYLKDNEEITTVKGRYDDSYME